MKAVLVIDMPDDCLLCPLCDYAVDWKEETTFFCRANGKNIDDTCEVSQWCPLKSLPEEKDIGYPYDDYDVGFASGWVACLEEIQK